MQRLSMLVATLAANSLFANAVFASRDVTLKALMKRIRNRGLGLFVALVGSAFASMTASAAPPAAITGSWSVLIDQTYETLDITNQGGPALGPCRTIIGSLGIAPVRGYYCVNSGQFHLLHNNVATNATVRTFTGIVSEDVAAGTMHLAGSVHVVNIAFGPFGEFPLSGNK